MAIQTHRRPVPALDPERGASAHPNADTSTPSAERVAPPAVVARSHTLERALSILPLAVTAALSSLVFWGPMFAATASIAAVLLVAFFAYWAFRSYMLAAGAVVGG